MNTVSLQKKTSYKINQIESNSSQIFRGNNYFCIMVYNKIEAMNETQRVRVLRTK